MLFGDGEEGGLVVGHSRLRQLTGAQQGEKRAAVTDGLGLPARLLISSGEKPETPQPGQTGRWGQQPDRRTNALIGRHPDRCRDRHRRRPHNSPEGRGDGTDAAV